MPRIEGVDPNKAGLFNRFVFWIVKRKIRKLTGQSVVIEPIKALAHHTRILMAFGQMDSGIEKSKAVPDRYKQLAMLRVARLIECPF